MGLTPIKPKILATSQELCINKWAHPMFLPEGPVVSLAATDLAIRFFSSSCAESNSAVVHASVKATSHWFVIPVCAFKHVENHGVFDVPIYTYVYVYTGICSTHI